MGKTNDIKGENEYLTRKRIKPRAKTNIHIKIKKTNFRSNLSFLWENTAMKL